MRRGSTAHARHSSSNAASEELERATDALQSRAAWKHRTPLYFTTRRRQARFNAFLDLSASSIVLKLVYSSCPHHGQQRGESWRETVELERFYLQPKDGGIHRAHCEQLGSVIVLGLFKKKKNCVDKCQLHAFKTDVQTSKIWSTYGWGI